jgi:leucyl/phenylalanyl-tRNA--protein transferase
MFLLSPDTDDLRFPPVDLASPEGLLAIGGDLRAERLLAAYRHGVFPWYNAGQPILWWSPDPRALLFPHKLRISRSLARRLRRREFEVSLDGAFAEVIRACAGARPKNPEGHTWITPEMEEAYNRLHALGYAHSVEVRRDGALVGGLYGVALGAAFFGESMFSRAPDASKVALVELARQLSAWGFRFIDCQLPSPHLASLGAEEVRRRKFMLLLAQALDLPGRTGRWTLDPALEAGP